MGGIVLVVRGASVDVVGIAVEVDDHDTGVKVVDVGGGGDENADRVDGYLGGGC